MCPKITVFGGVLLGTCLTHTKKLSKFRELFNLDHTKPCPVDVKSIDGFQGSEKEVIIFSVVRADPNKASVGFVKDRRRMNVGITRARRNLFVLGQAEVLSCNEMWDSYICTSQEIQQNTK